MRAIQILKVAVANLACMGLCVVGALSPSPVAPQRADASSPTTEPAEPVEVLADAGPPNVQSAESWLRDRLAKAGRPTTLPVVTVAPEPSPRSTLVPVPYRPWLPPPVVAATPRESAGMPKDGQYALRPRPARDVPPLSDAIALVPPATIVLMAPPAPRIDTLDPAAVPLTLGGPRSQQQQQAAATDTTGDGPTLAVTGTPPARQAPVPPLMLNLPDVSRASRDVGPSLAPPDDDPPAAAPAGVAPIILPVPK